MYNGEGKFMVKLSWADFLKNKMKALGPSLRVNQMWTKKNDHAPKIERIDFFNTCPKEGHFEKISVSPLFCLFLGFTYILVNVSKMCLANNFTTILTKFKSNLFSACSM